MAYNTGNPIGSTDPRDLYDNAQNLDELTNSAQSEFQDRLGRRRLTVRGMADAATTGNPAVGAAQDALAEAERAQREANRAENEAAAAKNSASSSIQYAMQSASFADQSEAARDAALLESQGVYEDAAAGLAATTEGDYFSTPSSDNSTFLILYRHDAGPVATAINEYPSTASLDFYSDAFSESAAFAITDEQGGSPAYISRDGRLHTYGLQVGGVDFDATQSAIFSYLIADQDGNAALGVRYDGVAFMAAADVPELRNVATINGMPVDDLGASHTFKPKKPGGFTAEINGVSSYGQSLAIGSTSRPVISTTQNYDNLMFSVGVRTQDGGTDPSVIYSTLVPLVESSSGSSLGETPISGTTDSIKELILAENGLAFTDMSYQFLGTAPGAGGTPIVGLEKDSAPYLRLLDDIKYGYLRSADSSKSYAYQATTWMQGEADYSSGTPKEAYKLRLKNLADSISKDAVGITNQSFAPAFITYQVGSHLRYAQSQGIASAYDAQIAQAQLEVAIESPDIHLACPMYPFDYVGTVNQVHLTAADERAVGAYFGLAYKRTVIDAETWEPLRPVGVARSGNAVYLTLNVPEPPLVIDTDWVSENKDYGFRVFDGNGAEVTISSVSIVNDNAVKIVCASLGDGPVTVDYALFSDNPTGETGRAVGARGNIRDSQGDTIVFDPAGINRPLHNWLVMFKYTEGESSWL